MDHIPRPRTSKPSMEFPYYHPAAWDHDVRDFHLWIYYGSRSHWDMAGLRLQDHVELDSFLGPRSFNDFAVFLQSWLYFGMLALCLGRNDLSVLIGINSAGDKVLDTTLLLPLIQRWHDQTYQRHMQSPDPLGSYDPEFKERNSVLNRMSLYTTSLITFTRRDAGPRGGALSSIGTSIELVGYALREAILHLRELLALSSSQSMLDPFGGQGPLNCNFSRELDETLIQRGWCPNTIYNMHRTVGVEALIMASMIQKDATVSASHARCLEGACVANQVPAGQYVPKHADEYHNGGTCGAIGLPSGTAEKVLLKTTSFPVVRLWLGTDRAGSRRRLIEAVPYRDGLKYVAISHVWSDGLGDEKGNRILACQYDRLSMLLSEVISMETTRRDEETSSDGWSLFFWLDTICVPHQHAARRLACSRMSSSYECADTVLVLDAELQAWPFASGTDEEALLRIVTSGWMTRVWTLSEGILAKRLVFKLADTMFDYDSSGDRLRSRKMNGLGRFQLLPAVLFKSLDQMKTIKRLNPVEKLVEGMFSTKSRRTSHPGDEIISLAVLVGLDGIENIYDKPTWAEKMMLFLQMMPELPLCLLFHIGPRLSETGFRWAPAALDSGGYLAQMMSTHETAELDRKNGGLLLSHPGILLHGDWIRIALKSTHSSGANNPFHFPFRALYRQLPGEHDLDHDTRYEEWCLMESCDGWHLPPLFEEDSYCSDEQHEENELALDTTALAVIVNAPNFYQEHSGRELLIVQGALVSNVVLEDSEIISCRYQCIVTLKKYFRESGPMSNEEETLFQEGTSGIEIAGVDPIHLGTYRVTKSSQAWRVV